MSIRKTLAYAAAAVGTFCVVYAFLVIAAVVPWPFACLTETKMRIANLSGMDVEVTYTNCDVIAKDEFVSVYASPAIGKGESFFARLRNRSTLVFRYDPGKQDDLLPSIKAAGDNRVLISNPGVSQIFYQSRKWKSVTIDYEIEHIDYPKSDLSRKGWWAMPSPLHDFMGGHLSRKAADREFEEIGFMFARSSEGLTKSVFASGRGEWGAEVFGRPVRS